MEFTKEQLIEKLQHRVAVTANYPDVEEAQLDAAIFKIALASLEAEPAIHRWRRVTVEPYGPYPWHYGNFIGFSKPVEGIEDEYYYSATPAPVSVPDDVLKGLLPDAEKAEFWFEHNGKILFEGVKFNNAVFDACRAAMLQSFGNSEQLNSPVIPDGWVMVPVDATRAMIDAARRVEEDGYDAMHKAMIAAAPQQEVNNG